MEEIGSLFLQTRESAGISITEVSEDLNIDEAILKNIEDGKSGAFSDIFVLKNYISSYAKYLGLDCEKVIDTFNEYVFESTSRIPIKEIEKKLNESRKNETTKISSPYTKPAKESRGFLYVLIYVFIVIAIILLVVWSVKQITIGNQSAVVLGYK